ncbi:MAG TPA: FkbM family methyltransferase [Candidatus Angelobacter sp.]|jgi:FkbM family methyltransferase
MKNYASKWLEAAADVTCLRGLSSRILSAWCSSMLKRPVHIFYDSAWLRKDGDVTIALGLHLCVRRSQIRAWKADAAEITELAANWWYRWYKPRPGDVVVDLGAGMGEDALLFSRSVGERGKVFSFEAHPVTARCLRKTIEYSKLSNVVPVQAAIFNRRCTLEIEDRATEAWQENTIIEVNGSSSRSFSVPAFPLDEFEPLQNCSQVDLLKMNIEGAEIDALAGMPNMLKKVRHVCVACHDFLAASNPKMKTKVVCRKVLIEAGFTVHETDPKSPPWERDHLHGIRQ